MNIHLLSAGIYGPRLIALSPVPNIFHLSNLDWAVIILALSLALALAIFFSGANRKMEAQGRQLAGSSLQTQVIFDHMVDGIVVFDRQRSIVQANPAAIQLLGLHPKNFRTQKIGETFQIILPDETALPREEWPSTRALQDEFLNYSELTISRNDTAGTSVVEISTTPIKNQTGETVQVIIRYRDITTRKQNLDTRARLAAIVESSADAIIGTDEIGNVTSWNAAAERIFGYTADEMLSKSIDCLVPADRMEEEQEFMTRIRRGEVIDHIEIPRKRKDGKLVFVSLTISPIRDANGSVVGASKIARDVTERKQLERQLYQSQKMEAIGQLTGGIAHDFNNLLGVMVGNLSLLERMVVADDKALKCVQTTQKAAWRGADLIRRLLKFSSDEELRPAPTSLNDSVHNLLDMAARAIGPEIKFLTRLDVAISPVFVDPTGLESALLNLAVNARDAMPKGGSITICTELKTIKTGDLKPGSYACVSLADTGEGMSQETLARVFEPFFTTKPRGQGTGLGLAMVYGFAKQSGGIARIHSELGYGTTVTLYLPLADAMPHAPRSIEEKHINGRLGMGRSVLLVDDEPDLLEIACIYLTDMGYQCLTALDASSALEVVAGKKDIDLIVTDVIMPGGMNGVELVQHVRDSIPEIKVIYSSGFSADALARRSGTIVDGLLLNKPYQRAEFGAAVRRAMETQIDTPERIILPDRHPDPAN